MRIEFERNIEDFVAFMRFYQRQYRRRFLRRWLCCSLLFGALIYGMLYILTGYSALLVAILTIPFILGWYLTMPERDLSWIRGCHRNHSGVNGVVEMEVRPDGLVLHKPNEEHKALWDAVGSIQGDADHTFIWFRDNEVYVIPHRRITRGDYLVFLQELARYMEAHTLAPLTATKVSLPSATPSVTLEIAQSGQG